VLSLLFFSYSAVVSLYSTSKGIENLGYRVSDTVANSSHGVSFNIHHLVKKVTDFFPALPWTKHERVEIGRAGGAPLHGLEVKKVMFTGGGLNASVITHNFQRFCDTAKKTLNIAFFDIGNFSIAKSIVSAKKRGVKVSVVTDNRNMSRRAVLFLKKNKVHVESDHSRALMHNKFATVDGQFLWDGSLNVTTKGMKHNLNDAIIIKSAGLTASYDAEFREMFHRGIYGAGDIGEGYVEYGDGNAAWSFFAPDDSVKNNLIKLIRKAKVRIRFMVFSFTHPDIADALIEAKQRGVEVLGVVDAGQVTANRTIDQSSKLINAGIPVKKVGSSSFKMHHKIIVVDGKYVGFGSFNWTRSADVRNDENMIVMRDWKIGRVFEREFVRVYR